jgi:hypothetical protein
MGRVLLPILFLVVSVGLYFTYIAKAMGEVQALKTEDAGYDQLLASAKKIRDRRAELTEQYKQLDAGGLKKVQKMIPDHIDNVRLLIDIDNIASVYGLRIRDFTFSNDQAIAQIYSVSEIMQYAHSSLFNLCLMYGNRVLTQGKYETQHRELKNTIECLIERVTKKTEDKTESKTCSK